MHEAGSIKRRLRTRPLSLASPRAMHCSISRWFTEMHEFAPVITNTSPARGVKFEKYTSTLRVSPMMLAASMGLIGSNAPVWLRA